MVTRAMFDCPICSIYYPIVEKVDIIEISHFDIQLLCKIGLFKEEVVELAV